MTREEEIKKQAERYTDDASNYTEWSDDGGWSDTNDVELVEKAFIEGAKWADNHPVNVWHDASKFPNKALPIIVEIDDDIEPSYEVISIDETDEKFWEFLVSDRDITMWAYVKDLLPKGGEK